MTKIDSIRLVWLVTVERIVSNWGLYLVVPAPTTATLVTQSNKGGGNTID